MKHEANGHEENDDGDVELDGLDPGVDSKNEPMIERQRRHTAQEKRDVPPHAKRDAWIVAERCSQGLCEACLTVEFDADHAAPTLVMQPPTLVMQPPC